MNRPNAPAAVDTFLSKGCLSSEAGAVAAACNQYILELSRKSLVDAVKTAQQFARRADSHAEPMPLTAARALARVLHMSGRYREAELTYLKARRLARGDPRTRALIDRSLIDLYMYLDRIDESRRRARAAARVFKKLQAEDDLAKTQVNLGNVLHRQDRHREAEELYRKAANHFVQSGDQVAAARCYYNRANALLQLFEVDKARKLYETAEKIWTDAGFELDATDARYGQAWLLMLTGEFHRALFLLSACQSEYLAAGHEKMSALCELDRAEVYLGLNLFEDARHSAGKAEQSFSRLRLSYETAKARFFRAHAAAGLGRKREALPAIRKACQGFEEAGNVAFAAAAEHLNRFLTADGEMSPADIKRLRRQFSRAQLPLWEAICDLQLVRLRVSRKTALERLSKNSAVKHVPHLFAAHRTELGDEYSRQGRLAQARKQWQQAADKLDSLRAQLPPIELRNTFARGRGEPHRRLIESQIEHDPTVAAAWSERLRTAGIWSPMPGWQSKDPVRRHVEKNLAALAARIENLQRNIDEGSGSRSSPVSERSRIVAHLQQEIRRQMALLEADDGGMVDSIGGLQILFAKTAKSQPIIQFHCAEADLVAFVHWNGATRAVRWTGGVARLAEYARHWRFLLESELVAERLGRVGAIDQETTLLDRLGDWLWSPLELPSRVDRVVILPDGELANLPWLGLRYQGKPMVERYAVTQAPSLRHYLRAKSIRPRREAVRIFAGISSDLPAVKEEMQMLKSMAGDDTEAYDPCRRENWPEKGDFLLWHYAGHANLRAENPFYSYIGLDDGPLFAADFRLRRAQVSLVTLAACRSGQQVAPPGEEPTGLVRSLLEMGARNVIAGHWPVADRSTALWMSAFYERFFADQPIQASMRQAALTVREKYPSAYHWSAYSVFGAGH